MLFTFVGGAGHYEPLRPIATCARDAGHQIVVACRPSMVAQVAADGFAVGSIEPDVPDLTAIVPLQRVDEAHEERVLRHGFAGTTARRRATGVLEICTDLRPDIVVSDEVDYGAILAAEVLGIPHVTVLVLITGTFARPDVVGDQLNELRAELGLDADPSLAMLRRHLVVAPFPSCLRDPGFPLPSTARCIRPGSLHTGAPPIDLSELDDRPTVYFTLGTIFNMESGDLFARVLDGLRQCRVNVVATVGRQLDPATFGPQPPNVRIERFIPQAAVLPACDLVVSHGGSGSVVGALAHGLPSVLLPMGADQPHNARRCAELGVALTLDPVDATAEAVRDAVDALLADGEHRRSAQQIKAEIDELPAARTIIPVLEQLAG